MNDATADDSGRQANAKASADGQAKPQNSIANLQVKNVPLELHQRLREYARESNCTMSAIVLAALERELERVEWRKRHAQLPKHELEVPAWVLVEEARAEREAESEGLAKPRTEWPAS